MIRSTGKMAVGDKVSGRWPAVSRFVRVLAPVLLFLWPFVGIRQGVDIGDTTYALANYVYIDRIDPMWLLATWLPNVCGSLITHLPGGGSLFGVRLWCTPVICATALIAWFATERLFRDKEGGTPVLFLVRFAGIWIAEGLCWCPVVILYNYLTYLFLTLASVFLLFAFARTLSDDTLTLRRGGWYLSAGICLGLNLFVRFPNIVEVLLILAVWFHEGRIAAKKQGLSAAGILARCAKATGICVLGFIPGVIIPLVIISIRYGFDAYPRMIAGLFSMTEGASDYTLSGMLFDTLRAYTASAVEMLPLLLVLAFGTLIFTLTRGRRVLRTAGILVFAFFLAFLFRIYYSAGVFTRSYYYYDCMFEPAMMVIIFGLILCVLAVFGVFRTDPLLRSASFLTILVILILPIGSNNYTFPIVNDLFLILPVTGLLFFRAVQSLAKTAASETARHTALAEGARLPVIAAGALLFLLLAVQATLFHCFYTFGDGMDGSRRDATVSIPRAAGMITTSTGKRALEELYLRCSELSAEEAVIFGNAPGLHYLLELPPALFTAWPDLDSNETKRIEEALTALAASDDRPLVILRGNGTRNGSPWDFGAPEKADLILDYLSETGYNKLFRVEAERGTFYEVYGCE